MRNDNRTPKHSVFIFIPLILFLNIQLPSLTIDGSWTLHGTVGAKKQLH
jgi:hypothetical protein